tara:strand:- start:879 stop:1379 length:501 start_codon:yes stop_codon:yes gene_type:complete
MDTAKLQELLLKFEGRIGPNSLMQGAIAVLALGLLINLLGLIIPGIGLLGIVLLYPLFCIYAKRLHDGGKPAVWTLAVFAGMFVIGMIISAILTPLLVGDIYGAALRGETITGMGWRFKSVLVSLIISVVVHLGTAFAVNQFVKGDPAPNAYGEPPADAASINPLS